MWRQIADVFVGNDTGQALRLAGKAVELDPASPAARIALSYAQQAAFKIEEARASVQKAVDLAPQNALAWARLAELEMMVGNLDRALDAANTATALDPELARTQTVLGFVHLARIEIRAAKASFERQSVR
jgi:tetratricopeptide (TPR) repeat protein